MAVPPNLTTTHQLGVGERVMAADINDLARAANYAYPIYNVKAYGALGDNAADDTLAIQAAFDAAMYSTTKTGTVYFPAGKYVYSAPLVFYRLDNAQHYVNIQGAGAIASILEWVGSTSAISFETWQNKYTRISDITFNNTGARGTTIGLLFTNYTTGTGTNGMTLINVLVANWSVGMQWGGVPQLGSAASEFVLINCQAQSCDKGFYLTAANTLNNQFFNLQTILCTIGMQQDSGHSTHIYGGAASQNGTDFDLTPGGMFSLYNFRSEVCTARFVHFATTSAFSSLTLENCMATASASADGYSLDLIGNVSIRNCVFSLGIQYTPAVAPKNSTLIIENTMINDTALLHLAGGGIRSSKYRFFGNVYATDINGPQIPFDDEQGWLDGTTRYPLGRIGGDRQTAAFQDVRSLRGISGTASHARNMRGAATFVSAATAAVVFGTAEVQSLIATGASAGTFTITYNGATTTALNWNASAATVQAALRLLLPIGGANVTCTGGPLPNSAITITFSGTLAGGARNLMTTTSSLTGGAAVITRTTAGTGNPPETDTAYFVALSGNVNETFFVTAKATTGFTLNSSNAASAAVVDWHLIR